MLTKGVILFLQLQLPFSWWNPLTEAIFISTHPPILQMVKLDDVWNKHFRKLTILLLGGCESSIRILNCWFKYFPPSTSLSLRIKLFLVVTPTEEWRKYLNILLLYFIIQTEFKIVLILQQAKILISQTANSQPCDRLTSPQSIESVYGN